MYTYDVLARINELCKERNWTIYRLAKESGIQYSTLNNTILRSTIPSLPTIIKICGGLGITLTEFFGEGEIELSEEEKEILSLFNKLDKTQKQIALAYIRGLLDNSGNRKEK